MALILCKKSDSDWIAHENVASLWSCLSTRPTLSKQVVAGLIQAGSLESYSSSLQGAGAANLNPETQHEQPGSGNSENQSQHVDSTSDTSSIDFT
jgi:hypothetical protein